LLFVTNCPALLCFVVLTAGRLILAGSLEIESNLYSCLLPSSLLNIQINSEFVAPLTTEMASAYQPKQVTQYEASHLIELMGNVSETIINFSLHLIPPFKSSDFIHDNACGAGVVSQAILAKLPPSAEGVRIQATDINPQFVTACEQMAKKNKWPLEAHAMDARVSCCLLHDKECCAH
jgi:hypothetical protein